MLLKKTINIRNRKLNFWKFASNHDNTMKGFGNRLLLRALVSYYKLIIFIFPKFPEDNLFFLINYYVTNQAFTFTAHPLQVSLHIFLDQQCVPGILYRLQTLLYVLVYQGSAMRMVSPEFLSKWIYNTYHA